MAAWGRSLVTEGNIQDVNSFTAGLKTDACFLDLMHTMLKCVCGGSWGQGGVGRGGWDEEQRRKLCPDLVVWTGVLELRLRIAHIPGVLFLAWRFLRVGGGRCGNGECYVPWAQLPEWIWATCWLRQTLPVIAAAWLVLMRNLSAGPCTARDEGQSRGLASTTARQQQGYFLGA